MRQLSHVLRDVCINKTTINKIVIEKKVLSKIVSKYPFYITLYVSVDFGVLIFVLVLSTFKDFLE